MTFDTLYFMYNQSDAVEQSNCREVYDNYEQFGLDSFDFDAIDKDKLDQLAPEQGLEPTSSSPTRRPRNRRKASQTPMAVSGIQPKD